MAWAANTGPREVKRADGKIISFLMSNVKIYQGEVVRIAADGYLTNAKPAVGDMCAGIAMETIDNSGGTAGDLSMNVQTEGVVQVYNDDACTIADVGTTAVCGAADSHSLVAGGYTSAVNVSIAGTVIGPVYDDVTGIIVADAPYPMWIKLQTLRQIKTA